MKSRTTIVLVFVFVAYVSLLHPVIGWAGTNQSQGRLTTSGIWIEERVRDLPGLVLGPFVRLTDGQILTVDGTDALVSSDKGKNWERFGIFTDPDQFEIRPERALLCTSTGTIVLAFANDRERTNWNWDPSISDSPGAQLPTYAVRSLDCGRTWQDLQKLHDDWTGAIRDMIQTRNGRIVFTSMMMLHNPGRHSVVTYVSKDDGESWQRSNVIALGGIGHHGGVSEATIEELRDGRIWMLIRTNWEKFWQAFSLDGGLSWRTITASTIDASSAPALLKRLQSGRLFLVWNRLYPEGKTEYPLTGGDNQWSEVPVSNHREELSIAFSGNDGVSWTAPVVIARNPGKRVSYPYVFEVRPGTVWITTMQGELRVALDERDFVE